MDPDADTSRESLVTVSLSDSSSEASYDLETAFVQAGHDLATPHSSMTASLGIKETPIIDETEDEYEYKEEEGVDWDELERTEKKESRDFPSDESTAFLLARLERENARFERDPKALSPTTIGKKRVPLSVDQLRKYVVNQRPLRESMPETPVLTDLEFWVALVADYPRTASKLPFLLSKKIKGGVPPPLRGLVWKSMAGASDMTLESLFNALIAEPSPYDKVIGRDLYRTFPEVEMFRERGGHGQQMMASVLRAFSIYDMQVGYCQGLAFLVGPLLMHMDECSAFCILVRLMEDYDLRTMFTADMAGLHLRVYQFTHLLDQFVPAVAEHFRSYGVQSIYATQWFLSFFAVTCPLSMLLRIYDVIFAEGALETLMRVAIAVIQANESLILTLTEEDEILQLLLGSSLWEVYEGNADRLISDAMSLTTVATRDVLENLEQSYKDRRAAADGTHRPDSPSKTSMVQASELHAAASRFLGRIWGNGGQQTTPNQPARLLRRQSSRSSLSSTIDSTDVNEASYFKHGVDTKQQIDLHNQIEDLLIALNTLQKQHVLVVEELEAEKRAREDERDVVHRFLTTVPVIQESEDKEPLERNGLEESTGGLDELRKRFQGSGTRSQRLLTFKDMVKQLESSRAETATEKERVKFLRRDLDSKCVEVRDLKDQLFEIRNRYQDSQREKTKLERTLTEVRQRQIVQQEAQISSDFDYYDPASPVVSTPPQLPRVSPGHQGLRELRLGRTNQLRQVSFGKRQSSLFAAEEVAAALADIPSSPAPETVRDKLQSPSPPLMHGTPSMRENSIAECNFCEALRMELATAKLGEAVARQEMEETKVKYDQLRRSTIASASTTPQRVGIARLPTAPPTMQDASSPSGSDGGGWGKIGKFGWSR
ncbi:rab-GTPase-TBC domain-containing protein [Lipomyces arxii]|uniref:rab-GTPase-TBC domain-containing protein n=1 Tax=Lipomyces arxii TaxID=56418 RepID=UPI0034CEA374